MANRNFVHCVTVGLALGGAVPARAQWAAPQPVAARLDALFAAKNWNALGYVLGHPGSQQNVGPTMEWLKARIDGGGPYFFAMAYARNLTMAADQAANTPAGVRWREAAAFYTLYQYALIAVDGTRCHDPTAPSHRVEQLIQYGRSNLQFVATLPESARAALVDRAVALEQKTARLRGDDEVLCSGGMEQMQAGLAGGTQHAMPAPPGGYGKTVGVEPPTGSKPAFLPPQAYAPAQAEMRAGLRARLLQFAKL